MTSAAFSTPHGSRQFVSATKRAAVVSSATSQAADEAIRQIVEQQRLRVLFGDEPTPQPSLVENFVGAIAVTVGDSVRRFGLPMWLVRAAVAAAVFVVLGSAVLFRDGTARRHAIDGRVMFAGRPLADATLEFHLVNQAPTAEPFWIAVYTSPEGTFHRDASAGLPTGRYAVVVKSGQTTAKPGQQQPAVIPPKYTQPASTPLSVDVDGGAASLDLVVRN